MTHTSGISTQRIEEYYAHLDEGGQLSHRNAVELLNEVKRLKKDNKMMSEMLISIADNILKWRKIV